MSRTPNSPIRHLVIVLGDQLDRNSPAIAACDPQRDVVWMAEVAEESTHVWSHRARIALFLSAMRHYAAELRQQGIRVDYQELDEVPNTAEADSLSAALTMAIDRYRPAELVMVEAGDYRVAESIAAVAHARGVLLTVLEDSHFYANREDFARHSQGRKQLRLEFFYRELRKRFGVLMDGDQPTGGQWNFDQENRGNFGRKGPGPIPPVPHFAPDAITRRVLELVSQRFKSHPGRLEHFGWPVTPGQAQVALEAFIRDRLPRFGDFQDAMWTNEPVLYHSLLSTSLNLKLLSPRQAVAAAVAAFQSGQAPLPAVEGFIRQILGWREYVRGIYWQFMPQYVERNALAAHLPLPDFYWSGDTPMRCLAAAIGQTLEHGYAHHIQRLMVTGLYALLLGVDPRQVHEWYLAVYVDAVEWVELPNTLGMSQFADGGIMASKPYCATGKYIDRMSNYCRGCQFNPNLATGQRACPFTTLYWDFLARNRFKLQGNSRMTMQLKNLERKPAEELTAIRQQAATWRGSA